MSRWNNEEFEKAVDLLMSGSSYCEIATNLNRTLKSVKEKLNKHGFKLNEFKKPREIKKCLNCNSDILGFGISYCSSSCAAKVNNALYPKRTSLDENKTKKYNKRVRKLKTENFCLNCNNSCSNKYCSLSCQHNFNRLIKIENWKNGDDIGYSGKTKQIKRFIRVFLLEKYNYKCHKCGWNERNLTTGTIPLEVNHIDGDAENCKEENLEIICPNCHSLTHNFRALNKNSKRNRKSPCET
jgi:Zn finger protein HypA/HybF involved in hydrogenase expression